MRGTRHYWSHLFEGKFRREKEGAEDAINARLNFGYAVLRSMVARSLAMAGLNQALGLGHRSTENPFNLADDFIEPYRFVVEHQVASGEFGEFNGAARKQLLVFVEQEIRFKAGTYRLPAAIAETVTSLCEYWTGAAKRSLYRRMPRCRVTMEPGHGLKRMARDVGNLCL
jgi:CRISPR-associated protein Cas1